MKGILALWVAALAWTQPAWAMGPGQPLTVFEYAEKSWAVGSLTLGSPLSFRDGRVLVFPSQIDDLLWARLGKPRNVMMVYEIPVSELGSPFFKRGDRFFAPINVLPQHSYWRDNLPNMPRHAVAGGRRNVFRGDEIPEARRVLGLYLTAAETKGRAKWGAEMGAVAQALSSTVPRLAEDAVSYLSQNPHLGTDLPDAATEPITRFLDGSAPETQKTRLIDALGQAKIVALTEELRRLGQGKGPVAAAAMVALDRMGSGASVARLLELSQSPSEEIRIYAAGALGNDRSGDNAAFERAVAMLGDGQPTAVRVAAAQGLGWPGDSRAVEPLAAVLMKGDETAKPVAGALASIGGEEAGKALKAALRTGPPGAAAAAAAGLHTIEGCQDCGQALVEQYKRNPDKGLRDLIGVILEVPPADKH